MARTKYEHTVLEDGLLLELKSQGLLTSSQVPVSDWVEQSGQQAKLGVARVLAALDLDDGSVREAGPGLMLSHGFVANLAEPQALALGLPPAVPFVLDVRAQGRFTAPDFRVTCQWLETASRPVRGERTGSVLTVGSRPYRVPRCHLDLIQAIDRYQSADVADDAARVALLAALQEHLPVDGDGSVIVDHYLRSFRIVHATAFSLSLKADPSGFTFDPVLFGRRGQMMAASGETIDEAGALLTPELQERFARDRFGASDDARAAYTIERGTYVYLDPTLRSVLTIVRRAQGADAQARRRFATNPQTYLKAELDGVLAESDVESLFIETEQYSARVRDIGLWQPPVLPWIKTEANQWLPERFGLLIGDQRIEIETDDIGSLRDQIAMALAADQPSIEFKGHAIPATEQTLSTLAQLAGEIAPERKQKQDLEGAPEQTGGKHVLIVDENFEETAYRRARARRVDGNASHVPSIVKPTLKRHQLDGLSWLQEAWTIGYGGVLLADDMGLGKTLQALAFLAWLRSLPRKRSGTNAPLLVVAPTGLLGNWSEEHDRHLTAPGLGPVTMAFGRHLKLLRVTHGNDVEFGVPHIDRLQLQQSDWILTTYETLRDYHLSFASIPFACVVFDEMQKVKNPASLLTAAAKSLNTNFIVGLTGTPIENRMEDLWSIMDIVDPGRLGDLKSFSAAYADGKVEALEALRSQLMERGSDGPPVILRRMKADQLEGLPIKIAVLRRRDMPAAQGAAYLEAVKQGQSDSGGSMLETLHRLRSISLHPSAPEHCAAQDAITYVAASARLAEVFDILGEIAKRREKALIFLENLELQDYLAVLIKERFKLDHRPMLINGQVTGEVRQQRVRAFQERRSEFDVMILSPRAGGVGLTLTAANHVIHLSRWWNPAVEDQCTDRAFRIGQDKNVHVYFPMAIHPNYGDGSFDVLLDELLERKRKLSRRLLLPPVQAQRDEQWFREQLGLSKLKAPPAELDVEAIDGMEPREFERWVLTRLMACGWEAQRTPISHDGGADGILLHRASNTHMILQCKHRQSSSSIVADDVVGALVHAQKRYDIDARLIGITNAKSFSSATAEAARRQGVTLITRAGLHDLTGQLRRVA